MSFKETLQPLRDVPLMHGAPMGRHGDNPDADYTGVVYLEPILDPCPHSDGCYDYGGAYWGSGGMVYRCHAADGGDEWRTYWRGPSHYAFTDKETVCATAKKDSGWDSATFEVIEPLAGCAADLDGGEPCVWCHECEAREEEEEESE